MVMHARKHPRLNDGYYDRNQSHSYEAFDKYPPSKNPYNDRYKDFRHRDESPSSRMRRDESPARGSPRYANKSSYIERSKYDDRGGDKNHHSAPSKYTDSNGRRNDINHRDVGRCDPARDLGRLDPGRLDPIRDQGRPVSSRDRDYVSPTKIRSKESSRQPVKASETKRSDATRDVKSSDTKSTETTRNIKDTKHVETTRDSKRLEEKRDDNKTDVAVKSNCDVKKPTKAKGQKITDVLKTAVRVDGDWSEHISSSGKCYFYNSKTEVSQWVKPKGWIDSPKDKRSSNESGKRDSDGKSKHSNTTVATSKGTTSNTKYPTNISKSSTSTSNTTTRITTDSNTAKGREEHKSRPASNTKPEVTKDRPSALKVDSVSSEKLGLTKLTPDSKNTKSPSRPGSTKTLSRDIVPVSKLGNIVYRDRQGTTNTSHAPSLNRPGSFSTAHSASGSATNTSAVRGTPSKDSKTCSEFRSEPSDFLERRIKDFSEGRAPDRDTHNATVDHLRRRSSASNDNDEKKQSKMDSQVEDMDISPYSSPETSRPSSRTPQIQVSSAPSVSSNNMVIAGSSAPGPSGSLPQMLTGALASGAASDVLPQLISQLGEKALKNIDSQKLTVQALQTLQKLQQALINRQLSQNATGHSPRAANTATSPYTQKQSPKTESKITRVADKYRTHDDRSKSYDDKSRSGPHDKGHERSTGGHERSVGGHDRPQTGHEKTHGDTEDDKTSPRSEASVKPSCGMASPTPSQTSDRSGATNAIKPHNVQLSALGQYYREELVTHSTGWQADHVTRQAKRYHEESQIVGNRCSQVSADLKRARSLVRINEIQKTLQEQRILFLEQQVLELDKTKGSFMVSTTQSE